MSKALYLFAFALICIYTNATQCYEDLNKANNALQVLGQYAQAEDPYGAFLSLQELGKIGEKINENCDGLDINTERFYYLPDISGCMETLELLGQLANGAKDYKKNPVDFCTDVEYILQYYGAVYHECIVGYGDEDTKQIEENFIIYENQEENLLL